MHRSFSHLQAVGLAILGFTMWVLADASMKFAGASPLPAYEIIAAIGAFEVLLVLLYALARGTPRSLLPNNTPRQLLRSCLDLGNNICVVIALRRLPLALFYILVFAAPIVTALLAAVFLREHLSRKQGVAIVTGFLGVVVAVEPMHAVHAGALIGYAACAVCVCCFATNIVWSRVITQTERPESLIATSGLLMAAAGSVGMLHHGSPLDLKLSAVLLLTALFCVIGSTCFFLALRSSNAATVAHFHYTQLLTGALVAYLGWHEIPTTFMFLGAVLIVGSGAYMAANTPAPASVSSPESVTVAG